MDQASVAIFHALFLFIALKLGNGLLNKGSSPRPSSVQHANKYSNRCLSNVIVNHLPLLPSHGSVILLALSFRLLSQASAAFSLLPMTAIVFVSFIRFTVSHFPKVSGTHFSTTLFLCSREKIIWGSSRNTVPKATGWHPLPPDLYSYLGFNCIFSPRFSSTIHLPSSLTGRSILFLIQNAFLLISILQKLQRPLVTCWFFSHWLICWPCCSLLPFQTLSSPRPSFQT